MMIPSIHEAVAARCNRHGLPITAQAVEMVARFHAEAEALHDRASNREAQRLGGEVERAADHGQGATLAGARHHVC